VKPPLSGFEPGSFLAADQLATEKLQDLLNNVQIKYDYKLLSETMQI
jgi:hypothetical protein